MIVEIIDEFLKIVIPEQTSTCIVIIYAKSVTIRSRYSSSRIRSALKNILAKFIYIETYSSTPNIIPGNSDRSWKPWKVFYFLKS